MCIRDRSILSTVVDYTENNKDSPYKEMNYSPIYSRFASTTDLIYDNPLISGKRDLRKYHVIYTAGISLMTPMMLVQPI